VQGGRILARAQRRSGFQVGIVEKRAIDSTEHRFERNDNPDDRKDDDQQASEGAKGWNGKQCRETKRADSINADREGVGPAELWRRLTSRPYPGPSSCSVIRSAIEARRPMLSTR
jgi:hypothetical protein